MGKISRVIFGVIIFSSLFTFCVTAESLADEEVIKDEKRFSNSDIEGVSERLVIPLNSVEPNNSGNSTTFWEWVQDKTSIPQHGDGDFGNMNLRWYLFKFKDEDKYGIYISGFGDMPYYYRNDAVTHKSYLPPWYGTYATDRVVEVLIEPEKNSVIRNIGSIAFEHFGKLETVYLPAGLEIIGSSAFEDCGSLENITIPNSVTSIGDRAFSYCTSLRSIVLPYGITTINDNTFCGCTHLESVVIPNSVTTIGKNAFKDCVNLRSIVIPDSVTCISSGAFENCESLENVVISDGVKVISSGAFSNCKSLDNVVIPDSVTSLEGDVFSNCDRLTNIRLSRNVTSLYQTFENCISLEYITIPSNVTSIYSNVFKGCAKLRTVIMPEGVSHIGVSAFEGCSSLNNIILPSSIKTISGRAFADCKELSDINIPDGVETIEWDCFENCSSLKTVSIPSTVSQIERKAFKGCSGLESVILHNGLSIIEDEAFENCSSLKHIDIPVSVEKIGNAAFKGCSNMTGCSISGNVKKIDFETFKGCKSLHTVQLPCSLATIEGSAFRDCTSLKNIDIPYSVEYISSNAFMGCSSLQSVILPLSLEHIGYHAFKECVCLKEIILPEGIKKIDSGAFSDCIGLEHVIIPKSLTEMGGNIFTNCNKLTNAGPIDQGYSIEFEWDTFIPTNAFDGCNYLTQIRLPNSVKEIGDEAFCLCESLKYIILPVGVESLGKKAFYACDKMKSITIPQSVIVIGDYCLYGWTSITIYYQGEKSDWDSISIGTDNDRINDIYSTTQYHSGLRMNKNSLRLKKGGVYSTSVNIVYPSDELSALIWNSEKPNVAAVDETGNITSISEGTTKISVKDFYGYSDSCEVTVYNSENLDINGSCGINQWWRLHENNKGMLELELTGNGDINSVPWVEYNEDIESVIIGEGITSLTDAAFTNCTKLSELILPKTLKKGLSLEHCSELKTCGPIGGKYDIEYAWRDELPDGALSGIPFLRNIVIADTIKKIGNEAFAECSSLTSMNIPKGVEEIGYGCFRGCTSLTIVNIQEGIKTIPENMFYECSSLESLTIPEGVTSIRNQSFYGCNTLKHVLIPTSLTSLSQLKDCPKLKSAGPVGGNYNIEFSWVEIIPAAAFKDFNHLEHLTIPEGIIEVGTSAFVNCNNLSKVVMPSTLRVFPIVSITDFDDSRCIFAGCNKLRTIGPVGGGYDIEIGWEEDIPEYAFAKCKSIRSVTLPEGITTVQKNAFAECITLVDVYLPSSLVTISSEAFEYCNSLKNIELGNNTKLVGSKAFMECTDLTNIRIPNTVTEIGSSAFSSCENLTDIELSKNLTKVGACAFKDCTKIERIDLPNSIEVIDFMAFSGCEKLEGIIIPYKVKKLSEEVFRGCKNLKKVTLYPNVEIIEERAFQDCVNLTECPLPDSVSVIQQETFSGCESLEEVNIPNRVSRIEYATFKNCKRIKDIWIPDNTSNLGEQSFFGCANLQSINIPYRVTTIPYEAFCGCARISKLYMNNNLTRIEGSAFDQCNQMLEVFYNGTETEWNGISIGACNSCLKDAQIHYEYGKVNGISLNEKSISLKIGQIKKLEVLFFPEDVINKSVIWASSNNAIVKIDDNGTVTPIKEGTATIMATSMDTNVIATCEVKVSGYVSFELKKEEVSIHEGQTDHLDFSTEDIDISSTVLVWESSDPNIVEVDRDGVIKALHEGNAMISVFTIDGLYLDSCYIKVLEKEGLKLNKHNVILYIGKTTQLTTRFVPSSLTNQNVIWESSDNLIAQVTDNGLICARGLGEAVITARGFYENYLDSCTVKVTDQTMIVLDESQRSMLVGDKHHIVAEFLPDDNLDKRIKWESSDDLIVSIDGNGNMIGNSPGKAVITATAFDGSGSAECLVSVSKNPEYAIISLINQGNVFKKIPIIMGAAIGEIEKPIEDRTFVGWYHDKKLWDMTTPIVSDTVLEARFLDSNNRTYSSAMDSQLNSTSDEDIITLVKGQKFVLSGTGWKSSDPKILKISKKGSAIAKKSTSLVRLSNDINGEQYKISICDPTIDKTQNLIVGSGIKIGLYGANNLSPTWVSSNPDVAFVSDDGIVRGIAKGSAKITAYINGKPYNCKVKVRDADTRKRNFSRPINLVPMQSTTIKINGFNAKKAIWTSDRAQKRSNVKGVAYENDIVRITTSGKITAIGTGTTVLTASGTVPAKITVKVSAPMTRIIHMNIGDSKTIKFYGTKSKLLWKSTNSSILQITGNKLKSLNTGTTTLTTKYENFDYKVVVYIEDPTLTTAGLTGKNSNYKLTLTEGSSVILTTKKAYQNILFRSNNNDIAFVDEAGVLIARSGGKANITAKINGKTIKIVLTVVKKT